MRVLTEGTMSHKGHWVLLEDATTRQRIELNYYPPGNKFAKTYIPGEALDHFDVFVPDVEAAAGDLKRIGGEPTGIDSGSSHGWQECVTDPDGNWISLDKYDDKMTRTPRAILAGGTRVRNLRRSLNFYTKTLGFVKEYRGDERRHGRGIFVVLMDKVSHQRLELCWYPKSSRFATKFVNGEGLDHLGFRTLTLDDDIRRLKKTGSKVVAEIRDGDHLDTVNMTDPDGNWIELIPTE